MTVNCNQYKVGPEPRSATVPYSITSYSPTSITTLSNALKHGPAQLEYNGNFPLHGLQSRARCRTPPVQPSVTCPGERGLTSVSVGVAASVSSSRMDVDSERLVISQRMDGWPECFQDLRSWCHPDQDELNTPQITLQDEFNFNLEGQVNNCSDWGYVQSPAELNDSWVNQELLLPSPNNVMITDEENNNYSGENQSSFSLPYMKVDMGENVNKIDYSGILIGAESSSVLKTKGNVLLSQATLPREDSPTVGEATVSFTDYIKLNSSQLVRLGNGGKLIKSERTEEPRVPAVEHHRPPIVLQQETVQHLPVVQKKVAPERTRLKLSIPQAPQSTNESSTGTLATPEVLKPLTDIPTSQFDLLKYVCEGQDFSSKSQIIPKKEGVASAQDHDYTDSKSTSNESIYIKCEPLSPTRHFDGIALGVKRAMSLDDEDYDSDPSNIMDDDSESEEWSPSVKRSRRSSITGGPKRRGRQPSIVSIDSSDGQDKYRALRDRNNEASRRSRLNRKQRDMEMRRHKAELEKRNLELRVKADRMETLVKEMRAALLKSIKNSRNNSS